MSTERLYYADPYLQSFQASVIRTAEDGRTVYLNRSAFYPTSGGQVADAGSINAIPVVDVRDEGEWVAHQLERPLDAAVSISGEIDWERRYDNMQQHTGQHLLSAVIELLFGFPTVSVHMGVQVSTVELETPQFSDSQAADAEVKCSELIAAAVPVTITFEEASAVVGLRKASDRTGQLRIIEIQGVDRSACGGTHVKSTAELGLIQIRRLEKVRKNTRLEFLAGGRALSRVRQDYRIAAELSRACTVAIDDLPAAVSSLRQRLTEADKERQRLSLELARRQGVELLASSVSGAGETRRTLLTPSSVTDEARATAQAFAGGGKAIALILAAEAPSVLVAASPDSGIHAGDLVTQILKEYGGKGGGSSTFAQGSLADPEGRRKLQAALGF